MTSCSTSASRSSCVARVHDDRLDVLDVRSESLHERAHRRHHDGRELIAARCGAARSRAAGAPSSRSRATPVRTATSPTRGTARPRRRRGTRAGRRRVARLRSPVGTASTIGRRAVSGRERRGEQGARGLRAPRPARVGPPVAAATMGSAASSVVSPARAGISVMCGTRADARDAGATRGFGASDYAGCRTHVRPR